MNAPIKTVPWMEVVEKELEEIATRRKNEEVVGVQGVGEDAEDASQGTTGLALSGGGARAACVSMGVLQTFHRRGLLRYFDYLSTVSGGGYMGGYLSASVVRRRKKIGQDSFELAPLNSGGRQPLAVLRWICGGGYLKKPWEMANKYLIGLVLVNIAFGSALLAVCSLAAYLWRCLDFEGARTFLSLFELNYDLYAAFMPFVLFFFAWLIAWGVSYWKSGAAAPGRLAGWFLYLTVASLLIGFAILMSNGDTSLGYLQVLSGSADFKGSGSLGRTLLMLLVGGLLPFLSPKRLLESGTQPDKPTWQRAVFRTACVALLVGVPTVIVAMMAQENISGYVENRGSGFDWGDIKDWPEFCAITTKYESQLVRVENTGAPAPSNSRSVTTLPTTIAAVNVLTDLNQFNDADVKLRKEPGWVRWNDPDRLDRAWYVMHWLWDLTWLRLGDGYESVRSTNPVKIFWNADTALRISQKTLLESVNGTTDKIQLAAPNPSTIGATPLLLDPHLAAKMKIDLSQTQGPISADSNGAAELVRKQLNERIRDNAALVALLQKDEMGRAVNVQLSNADPPKSFPEVLPLSIVERRRLNRLLLETVHPECFSDRSQVFRRIVITHDQQTRWWYFVWSAGLFLCLGLWIDVNGTSMHRYYREQIAAAFLAPERREDEKLPLSELRTTDFGAPYHLISGTVSMFEDHRSPADGGRPLFGERRSIDSFLFSRQYCGSDATGYAATEAYQHSVAGGLYLSDAVALSGAAITPGPIGNRLLAFLMVILNLRLGQWLPNPRHGKPRFAARILSVLASMRQSAEKRPYVFVCDGGFSENLGVMQLLKRRCKFIVAVDAGCDPKHQFKDLARLVRVARVQEGIVFRNLDRAAEHSDRELELDDLALDALGRTRRHFVMARIVYPSTTPDEPAKEGILIYLKSSLTGAESIDFRQYRAENADFPHHTTADQFFDEVQVESYRRLGEYLGDSVCRLFEDQGNLWGTDRIDLNSVVDAYRNQIAEPEEPQTKLVQEGVDSLRQLHAAVDRIADQAERFSTSAMHDPLHDGEDIFGSPEKLREMPDHLRAVSTTRAAFTVARLIRDIRDHVVKPGNGRRPK